MKAHAASLSGKTAIVAKVGMGNAVHEAVSGTLKYAPKGIRMNTGRPISSNTPMLRRYRSIPLASPGRSSHLHSALGWFGTARRKK